MADDTNWAQKIVDLEQRVQALEKMQKITAVADDHDLTEMLYEKGRELVVKHDKASPLFLQKKLLIDFQRANSILRRLESEGVVGPLMGVSPRQVLVKK